MRKTSARKLERADILLACAGVGLPLFAVLVSDLLDVGPASRVSYLLVLSLGASIFSGTCFVRDGGETITPLGIYHLSSVVFVGLAPGLMYSAGAMLNEFVLPAVLVIHLANVVVYALVRAATAGEAPTVKGGTGIRTRALGTVYGGLAIGGILLGIAVIVDAAEIDAEAFQARVAYAGVLIMGTMYFLVPRSNRIRRLVAIGTSMLAFGLYAMSFFEGYGRLVVVTLVLSLIMVVNTRHPKRWHKFGLLAAVIPALVLGGLVGVERGSVEAASVSPSAVLVEGEGLSSVYQPLDTFAKLVELDTGGSSQGFPRQHGATFAEAIVIWVPHEFWQNKPAGFGYRLTEVLSPSRAAFGHSMAALAWGEWFVNFGWPGVPFGAFLIAVCLVAMRRWQVRLASQPSMNLGLVMRLMMYAVATAGIADYVWVGMSSYVARSGVVLGVLTGVASAVKIVSDLLSGSAQTSEPRVGTVCIGSQG